MLDYITNMLLKSKSYILDFIAPNFCLVCKSKIEEHDHFDFFCDKCMLNANIAPSPIELNSLISNNFDRNEFYISNSFSLFSVKDKFEYIELVHNMKYNGNQKIGIELGNLLGKKVHQLSDIKYSQIIPLPIHHAKKRERGFNQSDLIATGVATVLNVEVNKKLLKRKRYTITQTLLDKTQRKANMQTVFECSSGTSLFPNSYLLIDDVLTSGATLNSAANQLLEAGAQRVDVATILTAN